MKRPSPHLMALLSLALLLFGACACQSTRPLASDSGPWPRVRFLLTFDDGPCAWPDYDPLLGADFNSTRAILSQLATNDVQPGICAIFFTQPVHPHGGALPQGRAVMRQMQAQGHLVEIHSVSPEGHVDHTDLKTNELAMLLIDARRIIRDTCGEDPAFVRPPYCAYNWATRRVYQDLGLTMLLDDISARDGVIYVFTGSPTRRLHIRHALARLRAGLAGYPAGAEPYPIVVLFHDVNPYTARHMTEYLHILTEEAARAGLVLPDKPFYANRDEAAAAARFRCLPPPSVPAATSKQKNAL